MNRPTQLAAMALATLAAACPGKRGGTAPDAGGRDAGPSSLDGGADGGVRDAGRDAGPGGCQADVDCLPQGMRCAPDGGCVPAAGCDPTQGSSNCTNNPYCWTDGINTTNSCYCHPADGGGLCYVQIPPCGACASSLDCGPASQVDNPGVCAPVGSAGSYCLPLDQTGNCPPGFVAATIDGGVNVCTPSCQSCPCAGCATDEDCPVPASGVCNGAGVCEPPCRGPNDCPNGQLCHVLDRYLDPAVGIYYAGGKCGPPCSSAASCASYLTDGGPALSCETDDGGTRCRPSGCISDEACASAGLPDASTLPWCDFWHGNDCVTVGCRIGLDPFSQSEPPFNDCIADYGCDLPDGGAPPPLADGGPPLVGRCFQLPCYVAGGAHVACAAGELCCGEGDGGLACGGAKLGACYPEPSPPWCVSCDPSAGSFYNAACAVAGTGVAGPTVCQTAHGIPQSPPAYCGAACDPKEPWTCPADWSCDTQPYLVSGCGPCGSNPCVDAGPDSQGNAQFECGCGLLGQACPIVAAGPLFEGPDCSGCPEGASGCQRAADDAGYNCLCSPDGGSCPATAFGGQSFPSACVDVSNGAGTFGCVAALATQCQAGLCNFGHACTAHRYSCGWDGGV